MRNYGLDLTREADEQQGDEWKFGFGSLPPLFAIPASARTNYLPTGEVQRGKEDTMDCATRGPINKLEAEFTYAVKNKLISEKNIAWLTEKGYLENGRVTFSDAFNAILSGTSRNGNSMKAPIQSIHSDGLIPKKMLPLLPEMTWDEYHDKSRITLAMKDLGRAFSKRFTINYEQVSMDNLKELNEKEMIVVGGFAWSQPDKKGVYQKTNNKPNHVWVNVHPEYLAFDNYVDSVDGDFLKKLAKDYKFFDYGYRIFVTKEDPNVEDAWWSISFLSTLIQTLKDLLTLTKRAELPVVAPLVPETTQTPPEPETPVVAPSVRLYEEAMRWVGKDASPDNRAPQELACAESVSHIIRCSIDPNFPKIVSTIELNKQLGLSVKFKRTLDLKPGFIIVSPTGTGNGRIRGHAGILGYDQIVMSNDSRDGKWHVNYTVTSWVERYRTYGGMPVYVYEPI